MRFFEVPWARCKVFFSCHSPALRLEGASARTRPVFSGLVLSGADQILPAGLLLPVQQVADELIGHQKALGRQPPPAAGLLRPALGLELAEPGLQGGKVHEIGAAVHIRRLRGKMKDDTREDKIITTVWGVGYKIEA